MNKVLIICDHQMLYETVQNIITEPKYSSKFLFDFHSSIKCEKSFALEMIDLQDDSIVNDIIKKYFLVLSLHSKQIFPKKLVDSIKCINLHPGYNPYNKGIFPHIHSIINKYPVGVTIHEMDTKIDNGNIIIQEELPIMSWDTSGSLYKKIFDLEIKLLKENLYNILNLDYQSHAPIELNSIPNTINDFKKLCHIDLNKLGSFAELIDLLRALTHEDYRNAYFYDENNQKIFVKIILDKE